MPYFYLKSITHVFDNKWINEAYILHHFVISERAIIKWIKILTWSLYLTYVLYIWILVLTVDLYTMEQFLGSLCITNQFPIF